MRIVAATSPARSRTVRSGTAATLVALGVLWAMTGAAAVDRGPDAPAPAVFIYPAD